MALLTHDVVSLLAATQHHSLVMLSDALDAPYTGLTVAARHAQRAGLIKKGLARRLANLDIATHVARHMTKQKSQSFLDKLHSAVIGHKTADPGTQSEAASTTNDEAADNCEHLGWYQGAHQATGEQVTKAQILQQAEQQARISFLQGMQSNSGWSSSSTASRTTELINDDIATTGLMQDSKLEDEDLADESSDMEGSVVSNASDTDDDFSWVTDAQLDLLWTREAKMKGQFFMLWRKIALMYAARRQKVAKPHGMTNEQLDIKIRGEIHYAKVFLRIWRIAARRTKATLPPR